MIRRPLADQLGDGAAVVLGGLPDPADLGKVILVAFLIFWFRFTYPRFREDQLQTFAWKFLIPVSLANIAVTAILKVAI